ncbi:MAG: TIM barrel protein [Bacteroidota bacterium]
MNRRTFLEKTSLLSAAALLPLGACSDAYASPFKLGYQLFSVNEDMNRDPVGTLTALHKMGYQDVEVYGFDPEKITYYGLPAADVKAVLDERAMTASSGHYGFSDFLLKPEDELKRYVDACIAGAKILQSPFITWPWLAPEYRNPEHFRVMAEKLNLIGEQVQAAGLRLAYHNHGYEFTDHNGTSGWEIILAETDPQLVKLQMDMYWVMHEGLATPKALVADQPGRFVMWHIKDMDKVSRDYTELGNGSIDYAEVLPNPQESGLEFFYIEQGGNFTHSPMQSAETSASYFQTHLRHLI